MSQHRTLILGESQSGKTHFVGQILGRTRSGKGGLRLKSLPDSLQMLDEVLERLSQGLAASHTPADVFRETEFDLTDLAGRSIRLVWPDYAGEQVTEIVTKRALRRDWADRIENADSLTLLIRLSAIVRPKTALEQAPLPYEGTEQSNASSEQAVSTDSAKERSRLPEQLRLIELLQIVRHIRLRKYLQVPPLSVLLTCVDEFDDFAKPRTALRGHLPLLVSFLETNWPEAKLQYWGVSSLGMSLSEKEPNHDFAESGPENNGYVVDSDGEQDKDLTAAFTKMLESK